MDPEWRCMDPIENGDFPASYVSLPEGTFYDTGCLMTGSL